MYSAFSLALIAAVASAIKQIEPASINQPQVDPIAAEPVGNVNKPVGIIPKPVGLIPDLAESEN